MTGKETNADRIRNMSDEELAEFLITFKNTFGEEYEGRSQLYGLASIRSGIRGNMVEIPLYRSVPTIRDYKDYVSEYNYTKGWNDAMDFIFPEAKKKREKERIRKNMSIINTERREYGR